LTYTATILYIAGTPFFRMSNKVTNPTDLFKFFSIGTYEGRTTAGYVTTAGKYIKNFIVSNRPVMLASHPMLRRLAFMGDSFGVAALSEAISSVSTFDVTESYQIKGYLAQKGLRLGAETTAMPVNTFSTSVNGAVIDDTGTAASKIGDQTTAMLTAKPTIVICYGGINDVLKSSGYVPSVFETEYKAIATTLLADGTGIEKFLVCTISSGRGDFVTYTAAIIARTAELNAIINALPEWWDANNPTRTGMLKVVDVFTALGGEGSSASDLLNNMGTWNSNHPNYGDDIHLAAQGKRIVGRLEGKIIYDNLI